MLITAKPLVSCAVDHDLWVWFPPLTLSTVYILHDEATCWRSVVFSKYFGFLNKPDLYGIKAFTATGKRKIFQNASMYFLSYKGNDLQKSVLIKFRKNEPKNNIVITLYRRLIIFFGYSDFCHQYNWSPWYNLNIVKPP